jgi:hypothetical protein
VLPLKRAEELILTLPSVVSARIVATEAGGLSEIHVLTTGAIPAKQMVRNIESALIAHFGMRLDHRKISVAVTEEPRVQSARRGIGGGEEEEEQPKDTVLQPVGRPGETAAQRSRRRLYFEDIEIQASRTRGVVCRVTLRRGDRQYVGESSGMESDRSRMEIAARATLAAVCEVDGRARQLTLDGLKILDAFERNYVFVGVQVRDGRAGHHFTGTCEIRDSAETAASLAILASTNRWLDS